ncbi:MAG: hypothetical protein V4631_00790, partial [Pseudomonadota bacterium]
LQPKKIGKMPIRLSNSGVQAPDFLWLPAALNCCGPSDGQIFELISDAALFLEEWPYGFRRFIAIMGAHGKAAKDS